MLGLLGILAPIVGKVIDKILPGDSEEIRLKRAEMEAEMLKSFSDVNIAQLKINAVEAGSESLFKSGWRPAVAWMGVFGLAWTVFNPLVSYFLTAAGFEPLPHFESGELTSILMGLLGLGGFRTYEKFKGIAR